MTSHVDLPLAASIQDINEAICAVEPEIERWFHRKSLAACPPFYASVDIRNSGFKVAPVDTNLFPAGWNNLSSDMLLKAVGAVRTAVERLRPRNRSVLVVPENHTRNTFYLQNVAQLTDILRLAGLDVRVGSLNPEIGEATIIDLPDGQRLKLEPLLRNGSRVGTNGFEAGTVLLNNDLSSGIPSELREVQEQRLVPPLHAGWHVRRKTTHFQCYEEVAREFSQSFGLDPWLITPMFEACGGLDFAQGQGIERLQHTVDALLTQMRRKYRLYGITRQPFAVVKANNGTYGMGVMTVRDAAELANLNRRTRNKMHIIKDGQQNSDVIVQEGVPTCERVGQSVAETVAYLVDGQYVGGFLRTHAQRGVDENLNAPGSVFEPLDIENSGPEVSKKTYAHSVIARLACLAAGRELQTVVSAETLACEGV